MPCPYVSQVLETCKFPVVKIVGNIDVIQHFPTDYMARNMLFFIVKRTFIGSENRLELLGRHCAGSIEISCYCC